MTIISYVSVPICDSTGQVTRVVKIPLSEFGNLITVNGIKVKALETAMSAVALE
jgi:hypothetical protein